MKATLYYHFRQYDWEDEGKVEIYMSDMTDVFSDRILLKVVECEIPDVELPSRELVARHKVAKLKEEKEKLRAETQIRLNVIEDKIRQLQALEYHEVQA
jgi:hypothetical protein